MNTVLMALLPKVEENGYMKSHAFCWAFTKCHGPKIGTGNHVDGLVQDCCISIDNALEIPQSCIQPLIFAIVNPEEPG